MIATVAHAAEDGPLLCGAYFDAEHFLISFFGTMPHDYPTRTTERIHTHRTAGRDRDHRDLDRPPGPCSAKGPRGGSTHPVRQQPQANRSRPARLPRHE